MDISVLGPLEVRAADELVDTGSARHRALLAALTLDPGRVVSVDTLIDRVWDGEPAAVASLQALVSRLRRQVGEQTILTEPPGYRLAVAPGDVDAGRFEAALALARSTGDAAAARDVLVDALALWRGPAYADVASVAAQRESDRLEELRLSGEELLAELDLQLGRHAELTQRLFPLVRRHPLREGLRGSLMLALYRAGRQVEALELYDQARVVLVEELGIDPGPQLQRLHARILNQDPALLDVPSAARVTPPGAASSEPAGSTPAPALVGRREPLARLQAGLRRAHGTRVSVAAVVGEAGIGKTTLVDAAVATAPGGSLVVTGRCWDHAGSPAYWPWSQAVSTLAERLPPETLAAATTGRGAPVSVLLPRTGESDVRLADGPELARARLFDAVVAFLETAAGRGPLVIVLEDLHWADEGSADLLEHVAATLRDVPVAIVVTVRDPSLDGVPPVMAALARVPGVERVRLTGLTVPEVRELVEDRVAQPLADAAVQALRRRTEGNPFYLVELARLLGEERAASGRADVAVPSSVRAVIERRLRHLPGTDQELLSAAAVIGRDFDLTVLAEVTDTPRWEVMECLDRALGAGLLSPEPAGAEQRFTHALVQETLTLAVPPMRRAALHVAIATVLVGRRGREEERASAIAHHLALAGPAGDPAEGVRWSLRAASDAERRLSLPEAERSLRQALDLAGLVETDEREPLELEARVRLGSLMTLRLGYNAPEVADQRRLALDLAVATGTVGRELLSALWGTWGNALVSGDLTAALAVCDQIRRAAAATDDLLLELTWHAAEGQTRWHLAELEVAADHLARARLVAVSLQDAIPVEAFLQHPGVQATAWLSVVRAQQGDVAASDELAAAALREAHRLDHPFTVVYAAILEGLRGVWTGEPTRSAEHGVRALGLATGHGFDQLAAFALIPAGWGLGRTGDPATGSSHLRAALAAFGSLPGGHMFGSLMHGLLADVLRADGRVPEARAELALALAEAEATGERLHLATLRELSEALG